MADGGLGRWERSHQLARRYRICFHFFFLFHFFFISILRYISREIRKSWEIFNQPAQNENRKITGKKLNSSIDCELTCALTYRILAARISPPLDSQRCKAHLKLKGFPRATEPRFVACTEFVTRGRAHVCTRSRAGTEENTNSDITLRNSKCDDIPRNVNLILF